MSCPQRGQFGAGCFGAGGIAGENMDRISSSRVSAKDSISVDAAERSCIAETLMAFSSMLQASLGIVEADKAPNGTIPETSDKAPIA